MLVGDRKKIFIFVEMSFEKPLLESQHDHLVNTGVLFQNTGKNQGQAKIIRLFSMILIECAQLTPRLCIMPSDNEMKGQSGDGKNEKRKLGHMHESDPKIFVDVQDLGVQTVTKSGKTLKLDRDVFREPKKSEEAIPDGTRERRGFFYEAGKFLIELVVILFIVFFIRTYFITPFQVDGNSMESTLANGEKIFINKFPTYSGRYEHGDIIVFQPPYPKFIEKRGPVCAVKSFFSRNTDLRDLCGTEAQHYVKRIIGLPGDTIEIREGKVSLSSDSGPLKELSESYLNEENQGKTCFSASCNSPRDRDGEVFIVPDDAVLVLGDNRTHSSDSRSAFDPGSSFNNGEPNPYVPYSHIQGTVKVIIWPPKKWQWLSAGE